MRTSWYFTHLYVNYSNWNGAPKDILHDMYQLALLWKSKSSKQLQDSEKVINTLWCVPSSIFSWKSFARLQHPAPRSLNSQILAPLPLPNILQAPVPTPFASQPFLPSSLQSKEEEKQSPVHFCRCDLL